MKATEDKLMRRDAPKVSLISALRHRAERLAEKRQTGEAARGKEEGPLALVQELRERQKELETRVGELTAELDAFSYSVSHDLREPLRHMEGFTRAIMEDYAGRFDATGRDYLWRINDAILRMSNIINAMLELYRFSSWQLNHSKVDMSSLAASVVRKLRGKNPGRKIKCFIARGLTARGDAEMLRIVLEHLLGNAWKFTKRRPSARIEFGTTKIKEHTVYFLRDNGVGFDAACAEKIFLPLHRLHPRASFPGTGFGLATAKRIIERHGGRIWAEGEVDKGAAFYFTLPPVQSKESRA